MFARDALKHVHNVQKQIVDELLDSLLVLQGEYDPLGNSARLHELVFELSSLQHDLYDFDFTLVNAQSFIENNLRRFFIRIRDIRAELSYFTVEIDGRIFLGEITLKFTSNVNGA